MIVMLAACQRPAVVEPMCTSALPSDLAAIDTLMQTRPDSALTLLMDTVRDDPYYHLLLSEALYKNDYAQTNRAKLLEAMAYFDSIHCPFLSARAHYMNGVGYYETDSVVDACGEYMKALEIMEENYTARDFTGHKAKFMALIYTRLVDIFSDLYLHEQAIYFGKCSLPYYNKFNAEPWYIARMLDEIGSHYDMIEQWDSTEYYYQLAYDNLPDTTGITYRDLKAGLLFLSYSRGSTADTILIQLKQLFYSSKSEKEYLSRCLTIGEIYYLENIPDSALLYLIKVFEGSNSIDAKKQSAEWLVEICRKQGKNFSSYADFLVPFANQEENKSELKSHLTELYCTFIKHKQEIEHQRETNKRMKWFGAVFGSLAFVLIFLLTLHKNKKHDLEMQITTERLAYETQQKAMAKRLQASNKALNNQKKEKEALLKELKEHQVQTTWDNLEAFLNEDICVEIMDLLHDKCIKREAKSSDHQELWLKDQQLSHLFAAVERHFNGFSKILTLRYPKIRPNEMNQCLLCLLDLKDVQIAALLHSDYSTIKKRSVKLTKAFGTEKTLQTFVRELVS